MEENNFKARGWGREKRIAFFSLFFRETLSLFEVKLA
jgi:hypothetical protein